MRLENKIQLKGIYIKNKSTYINPPNLEPES